MTSEFAVAVHGLVFLNHKNCVVSSEQLAENICTNPARVRKVMAKMKKAGYVETKEGVVGGYQIAMPADRLSLAMIADSLEVTYVSASWKSGDSDMECLVASGMAAIMDDIYESLNVLCGQKLEKITIGDIDKKIFG